MEREEKLEQIVKNFIKATENANIKEDVQFDNVYRDAKQVLGVVVGDIEDKQFDAVTNCDFSKKEILSNSLRFSISECPRDERGALNEFKKYQMLMRKCMLWLKDNHKLPFDGFMDETETL